MLHCLFSLSNEFCKQIVLCFGADCTGVSVVWSAQMGCQAVWVSSQLALPKACPPRLPPVQPERRRLLGIASVVALIACIVSWVFYAITANALTTIAHACSVVLGALIACCTSVAYTRMQGQDGGPGGSRIRE